MAFGMAWHCDERVQLFSTVELFLFPPTGYSGVGFFSSFPFFNNGTWDWADTPYVHDAHSTWLFRMQQQQISNVFCFFIVDFWLISLNASLGYEV